jgi:PPM family protein phosphatase
MELKCGFVCDRGLNPRRLVNQDKTLAVPARGLFAVFDGVGGQRAGEVASQTAAETIEETLAHSSEYPSVDLVRRAIRFANRDIYELATSNPEFRSMATTVALVHISGEQATIAHVGDSRVYRLENGLLYRETIDHTDSNDELRAGLITEIEAEARDDGNVINRALGVDREVDVEIKSIQLKDGARFLLCSDGVYKNLADDQIARELARNEDPQRAADELKRLVYAAGADDNLTALVVQVGVARVTRKVEVASKPRVASAAAGRAPGRISVEFNSESRLNRAQVRSEPDVAGANEYSNQLSNRGQPRERGSLARVLIYCLIVLVLMAGAFYAGLLASDRLKTRTSDSSAVSSVFESLRPGREAFDAGRYDAAVDHFDTLIKREPQNADAHYWLGRAQLESARYKEAAQNLERAIELQSSMRDVYLQAAAAYEADGVREKAERMLRQYGEELKKDDPVRQRSGTPR